jgi:predicted esterase
MSAFGGRDPHANGPVLTAGRPLAEAEAAVILVHGRGASAEDILTLAGELRRPDLAYLAPQAAGHTWYPYSFLAPMERNEPGLSSGLALLGRLVERLAAAGIPAERTVLLGFSQGACLTLEFAARNARRYGGVVGLSGGLIGPPGTPRDYAGTFSGTPIFLGCSDRDPHVPKARVDETAEVLGKLGAAVTERIYPGLGHTVNEDELELVRGMLAAVPLH